MIPKWEPIVKEYVGYRGRGTPIIWIDVCCPGPSCSMLGEDNPGLVQDLNSDLKA